METANPAQYQLTERRIEHLTLILGAVGGLAACWLFSIRVGSGVLIGAVLAWLNFRWLERALDSLVVVSTAQSGSAQSRLPLGTIFRMVGRYALIVGVVCVTFFVFKVPILSMLTGLCALGVATIGASLYEALRAAD